MIDQKQVGTGLQESANGISPKRSSKGAQYVLDMLSELHAIAELSELSDLSDEIGTILTRHKALET